MQRIGDDRVQYPEREAKGERGNQAEGVGSGAQKGISAQLYRPGAAEPQDQDSGHYCRRYRPVLHSRNAGRDYGLLRGKGLPGRDTESASVCPLAGYLV